MLGVGCSRPERDHHLLPWQCPCGSPFHGAAITSTLHDGQNLDLADWPANSLPGQTCMIVQSLLLSMACPCSSPCLRNAAPPTPRVSFFYQFRPWCLYSIDRLPYGVPSPTAAQFDINALCLPSSIPPLSHGLNRLLDGGFSFGVTETIVKDAGTSSMSLPKDRDWAGELLDLGRPGEVGNLVSGRLGCFATYAHCL